jgi:hypothetical protein
MSYHYPHHLGKIAPAQRTTSERMAELARRYPGITENEAKEILTFLRAGRDIGVDRLSSDGRPGSDLDSFLENPKPQLRANWREGAPMVGGFLVLLTTAWLVWVAFAEAAYALAAAG